MFVSINGLYSINSLIFFEIKVTVTVIVAVFCCKKKYCNYVVFMLLYVGGSSPISIFFLS